MTFFLVLLTAGLAQQKQTDREITLTGIVLVTDWRCFSGPDSKTHSWPCGRSDWGLVADHGSYTLFGNADMLKPYERKRAKVTGTVESLERSGIAIHQLFVRSIEPDSVSVPEIESLVQQLKVVPWDKPGNMCNPSCWQYAFTEPMRKILLAGPDAQEVLFRHIDDREIRDQVVMLLGGVGDERAIQASSKRWRRAKSRRTTSSLEKVNLAAELALTNLTEAPVNWHHGGGITVNACPDDPKSCWQKWWTEHRDYKVPLIGNRRYSNYPGYGIYAQP